MSLKNKNLDTNLILDLIASGFYFKRGQEQINLLRETNTKASLLKANGNIPVLFINGELDHRD
jgi:hypothetical protein